MKCYYRWFCHFDDDNYVNVKSLQNLLSQYDSNSDWYLGKPSIKAPLEIPRSDSTESEVLIVNWLELLYGCGCKLSEPQS